MTIVAPAFGVLGAGTALALAYDPVYSDMLKTSRYTHAGLVTTAGHRTKSSEMLNVFFIYFLKCLTSFQRLLQ